MEKDISSEDGGKAMEAAVAELRAFVEALRERPDIALERGELGRPLNPGQVRWVREHVHPELAELYAQMNGAHIAWRFIEPPGRGRMRIPPFTEVTAFTGEEEHLMGFGEQTEALLLDEITPEGSSWLVRDREDGSVAIFFASPAEGADGIRSASTISEYLCAAMASGLVSDWPRCFTEDRYVSYAEQEAAIARFRAAPVPPAAIREGARVHFTYFSEGGRGVVQRIHRAPASALTERCGQEIAELRLDEGSLAWVPLKWMKALTKADAYERLRDPAFDLARAAQEDVEALLIELARATGPQSGTIGREGLGPLPSHARLGAGLLGARGLGAALEQVLAIREAAAEARLDLGARRRIEERGEEFQPSEWARLRWEQPLSAVFAGLFGGLLILAHQASVKRGKPGKKLLSPSLVRRLGGIPEASALSSALRSKAKLEAPRWANNPYMAEQLRELGLPKGATFFYGGGM